MSGAPHAPPLSASSPPPLSPAEVVALQMRSDQMNRDGLALQQRLAATEAQLAAALAAAAVKGPRVKAPPITAFTGAGGNLGAVVDTFIDDLTQTIGYYGPGEYPNDAAKIKLATTYLRGVARTWWTNLTDEEHAAVVTWDNFVDALHRRFRPALPAELARRKLKDLKQRGTVNQYAGYFQQLLAHIPTKSEDDAIFDFRSGLDKAIAARVAEKEPKTLDEAIIIAVQAELYVGRTGPTSFGNRGYQPSSSTASSSTSAPMDLNALAAEEDSYDLKYPDHQEPASITRAEFLAALRSQKQDFLNALSNQRSTAKPAAAATTKGPAKLTDAERDRCFRENLCLRCRGPGHRAAECPKFPSTNRQNGRSNY